MRARTRIALPCLLALMGALMQGCGSDTPAPSAAQSLVGAALLSPDDADGTADTLASDDLPPGTAASAFVADDDLPPAG
jgi:hypothetical protein